MKVSKALVASLLALSLGLVAGWADSHDDDLHQYQSWLKKGQQCLEKKDYKKAIEFFDKAIGMEKSVRGLGGQAWYEKGVALYRSSGSKKEELACYEKAIGQNANFAKPYYAKGWLLYDRADRKGALENYAIALSLAPDTGYAWYGGEKNAPDLPEKILHPVVMGDLATVKKMLAENPELLHRGYTSGFIPATMTMNLLHFAVVYRRQDMAGFLISKGIDVNEPERLGDTPLHVAASLGDLNMVELLISKGANVNGRGCEGATPLDSARSDSVKQFLRKHGAKSRQDL